MSDRVIEFIVQGATLILGWVLGVLSPVVTERLTTKRRRVAVKRAIERELHELQYRMVLDAYLTEERFGTFDRDFLAWAVPVLRE